MRASSGSEKVRVHLEPFRESGMSLLQALKSPAISTFFAEEELNENVTGRGGSPSRIEAISVVSIESNLPGLTETAYTGFLPMLSPTIVPYLCVFSTESAIAFYKSVFGAAELERYQDEPGGRIGHATLELAGGILYLSDEYPEIGVISPTTLGGTPMAVHLTVGNVDSVFELALTHGAEALRAPADQGIGFRNAKFLDPFGHAWMISTPLG